MRTTGRTRKLSHLLFLVIVWSCIFQPTFARRRLPPKAGSWRYMTAGLSDGSLMILGLLVLFACFTMASAASAGAIPNILAVPLVAVGGAAFYISFAAFMSVFFTK